MAGIVQALFMSGAPAASGGITFVSASTAYADWGTSSAAITGAQAGDTVFIWVLSSREQGADSVSDVSISGYTKVGTRTDQKVLASLWYKRLTAADTAQSIVGGWDSRWAAVVYVFRGVAVSPIGTNAWYLGDSLYADIDPPSITPTVAGSIVLALGGQATNSHSTSLSAGPSGYNNITLNSPDMDLPSCHVGAAWTTWTSGEINPPRYTYSQSGSGHSVIAMTVAILPA